MKFAVAPRFDLRLWILRTFIFLVFVSGILVFLYSQETKQELRDGYITELNNEFILTISVYSEMSDSIYHLYIDNDRIKKLFTLGVKSVDPSKKMYYRNQLFLRLQNLYKKLIQYNFRQFHFHENNNKSFLRFHRPEKFGDDLTGVRASVEYANREKKYVSAFEEGRIFNGYRFIYPVAYKNEHIGSVEVSVSVGSVIEQLKKRFKKEAQFIILKDLVKSKLFKNELSNYIPWPVDNMFFLDRAVQGKCILRNRISQKDAKIVKDELHKNFKAGKAFCTEIYLDQNPAMLTFLPIMNFTGDCIAYIFSVSDNKRMIKERRAFVFIFIPLIILFLMLIVFTVYYRYSQKKFESMATYDFLTKVYSREVLFQKLDTEIARYKRYSKTFSIIMIDIDHFKNINDTFGHSAGDLVLSDIGQIFLNNIRETDVVGRYGGEEFIILLPETSLDNAVKVAENLKKLISEFNFHKVGKVTASSGVAVMDRKFSSIEDLINLADERLYMAKQLGRNRVVFDNLAASK